MDLHWSDLNGFAQRLKHLPFRDQAVGLLWFRYHCKDQPKKGASPLELARDMELAGLYNTNEAVPQLGSLPSYAHIMLDSQKGGYLVRLSAMDELNKKYQPFIAPQPAKTNSTTARTLQRNRHISRFDDCLRSKVERASVRDQLISFLVAHRRRYPDQWSVPLKTIEGYYDRLDLERPSEQEIRVALKSSGILRGREPDTYGLESRLLKEGPQVKVIAPCLEMDLATKFIEGFDRFLGKYRETYPAIYRGIFLLTILGSFASLYCLLD